MHDPTFEAVYRLERMNIRNEQGCATCKHKDFIAWDKWSCGIGCIANVRGFCRKWCYEDE